MQKQPWKKAKNWLVGDEKGEFKVMAQMLHWESGPTTFGSLPKVETPKIDAHGILLGKENLMQKQPWKKAKNWLVGDEKGEFKVMVRMLHWASGLATLGAFQKLKPPKLMLMAFSLARRI